MRWNLHLGVFTVLALFALVGCEPNPTGVHDEELTVELTMTPDHVHIPSPVTFTAVVRDGQGSVITDMDSLRVERLSAGSDTWRTAAELTLSGTQYTGEATFASSGEYELRVMGSRAGQSEVHEMTLAHAMHPINAARAHAEAGNYRIEFETFPGHIHDGDDVEVKFWIMEMEKDAKGERPAIAGLAAEIHCAGPDGELETHSHVESHGTPGEYAATHTFVGAGDGRAEIHFPGADGTEATAGFDLHIAHGH